MADSLPAILDKVRTRTPARLLAGRSGGSYRTSMQLELRAAHAAARDAMRTDFDLKEHVGTELIEQYGIFEVTSEASSKDEYLLRPDLGRRFSEQTRGKIAEACPQSPDVQICIGDGLSTTAVAVQVPALLPLLVDGAVARKWNMGHTFAIRFCRVGILNEIGDLLRPGVVILLIGERPGLATAESLSAYMAYRPRAGQTDAGRNLISNIHSRGVCVEDAAVRILNLAERMMRLELSGVQLREELPGTRSANQLSQIGDR
ncbi:MAG TPA: ethanolamine ammonia-lyase subunit EutC [Terriglobales bacterium]|nr:ethanolamine ammonia-lyase subunit EutC [Terriglobales bacterium]